jgi:hypothetical protein
MAGVAMGDASNDHLVLEIACQIGRFLRLLIELARVPRAMGPG